MLDDHDGTGLRWSGMCSGCLSALPRPWVYDGTRDEVLALLAELGWELVTTGAGGKLRCVDCARIVREVKEHDTRGRRVR